MQNILQLERTIGQLNKEDPATVKILTDIFSISSSEGSMEFPESFQNKAWQYFGNKKQDRITETKDQVLLRLKKQHIINVYNKWTGEGSLFNSLRAERPGISGDEREKQHKLIDKYVQESSQDCDFCQPEKYTPEDVFGRVKGKHCITGANIAKYDAWSSIVFFKRHHPLKFSFEEVADYLETGWAWFLKVHQQDLDYKYPSFLWNCLPRAGASQIHGHAQILMSKKPYAKSSILRKASTRYQLEKDRDYFQDLYRAHKAVGLATGDENLGLITSLTPIKEKELLILSKKSPYKSLKVKKFIYSSLRTYLDVLGVTSFNLSISGPDINENEDIPYLVRMVDRGSVLKSTTDMGAMELYGSSVIADDPYRVMEALKIVEV